MLSKWWARSPYPGRLGFWDCPGSQTAGRLSEALSALWPVLPPGGREKECSQHTPSPKPRDACLPVPPPLTTVPGSFRPSPVGLQPAKCVPQPRPLHRPLAAGSFAAPREVANVTCKIVLTRAAQVAPRWHVPHFNAHIPSGPWFPEVSVKCSPQRRLLCVRKAPCPPGSPHSACLTPA